MKNSKRKRRRQKRKSSSKQTVRKVTGWTSSRCLTKSRNAICAGRTKASTPWCKAARSATRMSASSATPRTAIKMVTTHRVCSRTSSRTLHHPTSQSSGPESLSVKDLPRPSPKPKTQQTLSHTSKNWHKPRTARSYQSLKTASLAARES